jgi:PST family polysaccharide transporter
MSAATPPTVSPIGTSEDDAFRTDHLQGALGGRTVAGAIVTGAGQAVQTVLTFGSVAILARVLTPDDFGLVAMAGAVNALFSMFRDAGLATVTVQRARLTHAQVSNMFWINAALGAVVAVISASLTFVAAWFYHDRRLVGVMLPLSMTFVLAGCTVQQEALLARQMRFLAKSLINISAATTGLAVAWWLALNGFGYWSLVWMQLSVSGSSLILNWAASGWRPSLPRRQSGTRSLLRFGVDLTAAGTISRLASSTDTFLLGRLYGAEAVGFYSRAGALLIRPLEQVLSPAGAVLLPSLSRLQEAPERYRRAFVRAFDLVAFICFPMTALLSALSEPLVRIILGDRWLATIPVFAAFSFAGIYAPLGYLAGWLFESQGRGRDAVRANVALALTTVAAIGAGLPYGAVGVAWALSLSGLFLRVPLMYYFAGSRGPVSIALLWTCVRQHLLCWAAVFVAATLTRQALDGAPALLQVLVCVPVALAAGILAVAAVRSSRDRALRVFTMVRSPSRAIQP